MDLRRGLADDLIYGRDLDSRPGEIPLSDRPEFTGAAGLQYRHGEYGDRFAAWSTSNALELPSQTMLANPANPAARPYAGMRTSLAFRSGSAEMPLHMHAFVAREFSELDELERMRQRAVAANAMDTQIEHEASVRFAQEITLRARATRSRLDFVNAGGDGLVNEAGDFNDFTHAGKDTLSAIRI